MLAYGCVSRRFNKRNNSRGAQRERMPESEIGRPCVCEKDPVFVETERRS